jgi:hypothetical protein
VEAQVNDQKGGVDKYSFIVIITQQEINSAMSISESLQLKEQQPQPQPQPENNVIQTETGKMRNAETPPRIRQ